MAFALGYIPERVKCHTQTQTETHTLKPSSTTVDKVVDLIHLLGQQSSHLSVLKSNKKGKEFHPKSTVACDARNMHQKIGS